MGALKWTDHNSLDVHRVLQRGGLGAWHTEFSGCISETQERSTSHSDEGKPYTAPPRCPSDRPTGAHLSLRTTPEGRLYHPSHFTDEQTEAQKVQSRVQGHRAKKLESQALNLRRLAPQYTRLTSPHGPGQDQRSSEVRGHLPKAGAPKFLYDKLQLAHRICSQMDTCGHARPAAPEAPLKGSVLVRERLRNKTPQTG